MMYFITDGTKYHDGDIEEVYGIITTDLPRSFIEQIMSAMPCDKTDSEELINIFARLNITYTPFDWEHSTNVIGVPHRHKPED